ncbi:CLUMA_CG003512, isoform A [Clunio marinus]|uniref:CLUMA_CG003512, isoform A n=1 Tax=Clunio marinus TaxID=568069 RepID=A0A1J1HUJ7_9DIPT|nr:CLUMA_CG003512, isoform A [Clunio marinus]
MLIKEPTKLLIITSEKIETRGMEDEKSYFGNTAIYRCNSRPSRVALVKEQEEEEENLFASRPMVRKSLRCVFKLFEISSDLKNI